MDKRGLCLSAILELTGRNPAAVLISTMPKEQTRHLPALPPTDLIPFYTQLITANIEQKNRLAMSLIMLLFPRSTEFNRECEMNHVSIPVPNRLDIQIK